VHIRSALSFQRAARFAATPFARRSFSRPASVRADAPQVRSYEPVVSRFLPTSVLNRAHLGAVLKSRHKKSYKYHVQKYFYIQEGTIRVKVNSTVKALQIYEIIYDVQNR